jgi:fructose-bisphosphate aldolase/2-amino-3,7-dideoxy-D-threo-hept-6-ulosonate synthase
MDHGVSSGPIQGITDIHGVMQAIGDAGATAIIIHKGIITSLKKPLRIGLIMHLSASTSRGTSPNWKAKVGTVEEALFLGADGVSVHVNIGGEREVEMLSKLGLVSEKCNRWGMPLLAMMYPRGRNVKDPFDPEVVAHVTRIGAELGADIVKTNYTGDPDSFKTVVEGCPAPVVIAGGPKTETDEQVLQMVAGAIEAGAIGVTFGRNIFQHQIPASLVRALSSIIRMDITVEEALEMIAG